MLAQDFCKLDCNFYYHAIVFAGLSVWQIELYLSVLEICNAVWVSNCNR